MAAASKTVLVIGSLNMDLVARCERLPQRGQTIMGSGFFTAPGGKGANQAVAAARLGARVRMAGCVGRDSFGDTLIAGLRDAGIQVAEVVQADAPTGTALITLDASGANTIVVIPGANATCGVKLAEQAVARAGGPGILLLQHEIPAETNLRASQAARQAGWFVMLNPAPARPVSADLMAAIDLVAPNETEAAALSGRSIASRDDAIAAAGALQAMGAPAVIVTLGGDGAIYRDASHAWHCQAARVAPVDTTAAGDAYLGAYAAALAEGAGIEQALGFASVAAGLAVTRLGAQPSLPARMELDAFIARHGRPAVQVLA